MAVAYPQMPTAGRQRRTVLGTVILLVVFGVCGLVILGLVSGSIGLGPVLIGALGALLPVGPVVWAFLWIDRWEPEPPRTLLFGFLWGASVAALTALIINSSAALIADAVLGEGSGDVLGATVVAPFVEEGVKGAFVVGMLLFRRQEFDGVVDGIVYAGLVAAGFAFTENILYIGRAFADDASMSGQSAGVIAVLILRGVFSPFAHPLFTSMTGIGCGLAAGARSGVARVGFVLGGYLLAVFLHALWNSSATFGEGGAFFGVYLFIMVPLFVGMVVIVFWQRRREQRTVNEQLPTFAQAGWIAPSEVELLGSLAGRGRWKRAVRQQSGKDAARAVVEYQTAVTELAFLRSRMSRGAAGPHAQQWHDERLAALAAARARATGRPDALVAAWGQPPPSGWAPPPPQPPGWQPQPSPPPGPYGAPPPQGGGWGGPAPQAGPYGQQPQGAPWSPQGGAPGPYGQPQNPYGQPPQGAYGQPQNPYGQNPYGQPQNPYGPNPYGQPQNPYGQPQNPYGQPPQTPYGQPPQDGPRDEPPLSGPRDEPPPANPWDQPQQGGSGPRR